MPRTTLDLEDATHRRLSIAAIEVGVPKSALLRALIVTYLEGSDQHRQHVDKLAVDLHERPPA